MVGQMWSSYVPLFLRNVTSKEIVVFYIKSKDGVSYQMRPLVYITLSSLWKRKLVFILFSIYDRNPIHLDTATINKGKKVKYAPKLFKKVLIYPQFKV
ncbi:hypothetical protein H5410_014427 [Solanum commersonii]|uniref:Uncharacterized protein n=1 Tax=Solanum commersonii TaxID=4109 RepID=A0A9J5ZR76_SOLCO|nr:hypothetical protein H5410_014427 [Solanum commersonii]